MSAIKKILWIVLTGTAFGQNIRFTAPFLNVSNTAPPFLVASPSAVLSWCNYPANQIPCTNYATTYTSSGAACSNGAQDTPDPQPSSCQSTLDGQGNIGVWAPLGTYAYTICIATSCYGPYTASIGGGSGSVTSLTAGTGIALSPNPIVATGTVSIASVLTAGSCTLCSFSYNAEGQVTLASNGTAVTGATSGGGLTQTGTTLGLLASCSTNQVLAWSGSAWACSSAGTGTVTYSTSTAGNIPEWSSSGVLENSPLSVSGGGTIQSTDPFNIIATPNIFQTSTTSPVSCFGGSTLSNASSPSCNALRALGPSELSSTQNTGNMTVMWVDATGLLSSGSPNIGYTLGEEIQNAGPEATVNSGIYGLAVFTEPIYPTATIPLTEGIYVNSFNNNSGQTVTTNRGIDVTSGNGDGVTTTTTDATVYLESPSTSGTITTHYGLYIADQTNGGSSNITTPYSIYEVGNAPNVFQGHLNQEATGNWAGTCPMVSGTSCTFSISAAFNSTPICITNVQGASAIAGACSVSGTTVTITAASSNSQTWGAVLYGNPN